MAEIDIRVDDSEIEVDFLPPEIEVEIDTEEIQLELEGKIVANDYSIKLESYDGGHKVSARRGSEYQEINVLDGPQGEQGIQGEPGYTPIRGIDYWTEDDIDEMKNDIVDEVQPEIDSKQETLVSGENIKTINGESILGSGNIEIEEKVQSVNGKIGDVELSAEDVGALPDDTFIPTKVSELTNDEGFISSYTEIDPTVPSWAKQPNKPSYTATEVGALPDTTYIPTKVSDLANDEGFITSYTETDPTVPSWAKQTNKPSYTASEVGALPDDTFIPTKVSDLDNDVGYITSYTESDPTVPDWAKQPSKPDYTASEVGALSEDTFIPSKTSDLDNDDGFITLSQVPVQSVNGKTGVIELSPSDIGIGNVFQLKGSVESVDDLPATGNNIGDVYYVSEESVGYIWLNDETDTERWEQLGVSIDLSNYATKTDLNNGLNTKITSPSSPVVGRILKVKSVNQDGTFVCEWSTIQSAKDELLDPTQPEWTADEQAAFQERIGILRGEDVGF